jgi:alpha-tubulin suppressor-like RCC1 family protein
MIKWMVRIILVFAVLSMVMPVASQAKIISISAGLGNVLALDDSGNVWAWGYNIDGRTGTGTTGFSIKTPQKVLIDNVKAISARGGNGLALKKDGTIWAWGSNDLGQLGNGGNTSASTPGQIKGLTDVVAISAGSNTGYALKSDGTVWAWGLNDNGQIGDGTTENRLTPVQMKGLTDVKALEDGGCYAIKGDGSVYAWGMSESGELHLTPYQVTGIDHVKQITSGEGFTVSLKDDGTVWAWGTNRYGALGDGTITNDMPYDIKMSPVQTKITDVMDITANAWHGIALKNDGTVWYWGDFFDGRAIDVNYGSPLPAKMEGLDNVVDVSTSSVNCLVLKNDGSVWGWGMNGEDQLGDQAKNGKVVRKPILIFTGSEASDPAATPSPGASGAPSPGFGFGTIMGLSSIFLIAGLSSRLMSKKKP